MTMALTPLGVAATWALVGLLILPHIVLYFRTSHDLELVLFEEEPLAVNETLLSLAVLAIWPVFIVLAFASVFRRGDNGTDIRITRIDPEEDEE